MLLQRNWDKSWDEAPYGDPGVCQNGTGPSYGPLRFQYVAVWGHAAYNAVPGACLRAALSLVATLRH